MMQIGLQDADQAVRYYELFDRFGHPLSETVMWDRQFLEAFCQRSGRTWSRFLLGGCASPLSLSAMEDLICWLCPEGPATLAVVDVQEQAIMRLRAVAPVERITRCLLREDLLRLRSETLYDFIRLDYLQNFVRQQEALLRSLKALLAPGGILASVVSMVDEDGPARGVAVGKWGCRVVEDEDVGYDTLDLSRRYLEEISRRVGLHLKYGKSRIVEEEEENEECELLPVVHVEQYVWLTRDGSGDEMETTAGRRPASYEREQES